MLPELDPRRAVDLAAEVVGQQAGKLQHVRLVVGHQDFAAQVADRLVEQGQPLDVEVAAFDAIPDARRQGRS